MTHEEHVANRKPLTPAIMARYCTVNKGYPMSKHTDGDWRVPALGCGDYITDANGNEIAQVCPRGDGDPNDWTPEARANAHLIGAAPRLKEALAEMIRAAAELAHGPLCDCNLCLAVQIARIAINKTEIEDLP